jgi:hypothetical protein
MSQQSSKSFCILAVLFAVLASIFLGVQPARLKTVSEQPHLMVGDALIPPDIPPEHNSPITPGYYETSEYLIGSVAVGIILLESNGTIDPSTEDWNSTEESQVISEIQVALDWWSSQNPAANVSFNVTVNYKVPTSYEPINHPQTDEGLWISEAMAYLGHSGGDYFAQVRDYVNDLRNSTGTDWAFAIFVVDSSNDMDGKFADGEHFAYAYLGGPFLVMTYDNNGWGINNMDRVAAHEIGHIFYATDEYNGKTEYSGYLNVSDVENSGGIMDAVANFSLSEGTKGQVGWRDSDGDGIQDIVDTFPKTKLVIYPSNLTGDSTLTYAGYVTEVPYPNSNPNGTGRDLTINTIVKVEYRIDLGEWYDASPVDGAFDEAVENFTFTIQQPISETSTVEVRGINSVGNVEPTNETHTVTVDGTPPVTNLNLSLPYYVTNLTTYVSRNTTFTLIASDDISGVAKTYYKIDTQPWKQYTEPFTLHDIEDGAHTLYFYSVDKLDHKEATKSFNLTLDNTAPTLLIVTPSNKSAVGSADVNVTWTGLDYGSGIAYYEIKIDDKEYDRLNVTNHTFSTVAEGSRTITVKAVDHLGNFKELTLTFVVDLTPPALWVEFPKNGSEIKTSSIKTQWNGFDTLSSINHYEIRIDENPWVNVSTITAYTFRQLKDGTHKIDIKAVDEAGNHKVVRIIFTINTSLIGKPGWTDDIIVFGSISLIAATIIVLLLERHVRS